ncbi:beta-lactamase family protein [Pelomonas sp. CA6]|uniref:serine hydrolase domain-containing protein n=1 Tax=Pelomonas sp. CA6 TaxID=2907999 RepID=UPI001F4AEEE8|nr:serine hydrolase domain-containing protein [Pelomonas sp. CA6]MCH7342343.1 beta-lactamase family protein [Pelomonas sp. CA6]
MCSTVSAERRRLLVAAGALGLTASGLSGCAAGGARAIASADGDADFEARWQRFCAGLPARMQVRHVPGLALLVARPGEAPRRFTHGQLGGSGPLATRPVTPDTVFEAASMSKPIFAWLVLAEVQAGRLALDQPLDQLWPPAPMPLPAELMRRITPRLLLSHGAGLPNWRAGGDLAPLRPEAQPGERFLYSGEGYQLLQQALEWVCGMSLDLLARRRLFAPLGLNASSFVHDPLLDGQRARGHDPEGRPLPREDYLRANAAYTLYTSAADYLRLLQALMDPPPTLPAALSAAMVAQMLSPQRQADDRPPVARPGQLTGEAVHWGLGWVLEPRRGPGGARERIAYHSGSNSTGYRSYAQFCPERRSAMVMMCNGLGGDLVWRGLAAELGDA